VIVFTLGKTFLVYKNGEDPGARPIRRGTMLLAKRWRSGESAMAGVLPWRGKDVAVEIRLTAFVRYSFSCNVRRQIH
jgi:hypothetical protein